MTMSRASRVLSALAATAVVAVSTVGIAGPALAATDPGSLLVAPGCLVAQVLPDPALARVDVDLENGGVQSFTGAARLASGALYGGVGPSAGEIVTAVTATMLDGSSATVLGRNDCADPANSTGPVATSDATSGVTASWSCSSVTATGSNLTSTVLTSTAGVSVQAANPPRPSLTAAGPAGSAPLAVTVSLAAGGLVRLASPLTGCTPAAVIAPDVSTLTGLAFTLTCTSVALKNAPKPVDQVSGIFTPYAGGADQTVTEDLVPAATSSAPVTAPSGTFLSAFTFRYAGDADPQPNVPYAVDCSALGGSGGTPIPPAPPAPPAPPIPAAPTPPAQAAPVGLLSSSPVNGSAVRAGSTVLYRLDVVNPTATPLPVTLRLPEPFGGTWVTGSTHAYSTDTAVGLVDVTPAAAHDLMVTGTAPAGGTLSLSGTATVTGPVGSTLVETGYVNALATNSASHPIVDVSTPGCTPSAPAGLCAGVSVPGLSSPADCVDSIDVTSVGPVAVATYQHVQVNDTLSRGLSATGCDPLTQPTTPDAQQTLVDAERAAAYAPGPYSAAVVVQHRTCVLDTGGRVVSCDLQPYEYSRTQAADLLTAPEPPVATPDPVPPTTDPSPVAPVDPAPPVVVSDPPPGTSPPTVDPSGGPVLPQPQPTPTTTVTPTSIAVPVRTSPTSARLPFTGAPLGLLAASAAALVVAGALLVTAGRRSAR